ncbi:MAG: cyclodeaminase/cyclohydrolase family protein, partial [Bryobacteraceae bacterium]
VAGLARKKKSHAQHVEALSAAVSELEIESRKLAAAMDADSESYNAVLAAFKLPKGSPEEEHAREAAIQRATRGAAQVPMTVSERCAALFERLGQLQGMTPASMQSDLRVGRYLAAAGARGALANVEINLESITDTDFAAGLRSRMRAVEAQIEAQKAAAGN